MRKSPPGAGVEWEVLGQAKTANALFALRLDVLGRDSGVRAFSVHPGGILTPLQRHLAQEEMVGFGWIDEEGNILMPEAFKTPEQGAATQVWAATSPQLDAAGGVCCEDCDIAESADDEAFRGGVLSHARDPEQAARLWRLSAELTGTDAFATAA
jgi:NAD(P)-dependent dehydrogenase (short-subunit alcohol dehydrogenase family)